MKKIIILLLLSFGILFGQQMGPYLQHYMGGLSKKASGEKLHLLVSGDHNLINDLTNAGINCQTQLENMATIIVDPAQLNTLLGIKSIKKISMGPKNKLYNSKAVVYQNVEAAYNLGYTGSNVIVGVVDTGIDFYHPMFRKENGETRILYIWDQPAAGSPHPSGYDYGVEYTESQINQDLISGSPNSIVSQIDDNGHGTHVTGSMAGYDYTVSPPDNFDGGATDANIIFVKTTFWNSDIRNGVDYIFQKASALGKPCVVNLSLGSQYGPHDGTEDDSQALNAIIGPGKIVVRSAGNDGSDYVHYFANSVVSTETITFGYGYTGTDYSNYLTVWLEAGDDLQSVSLTWGTGSITNVTKGGHKSSSGIDVYLYSTASTNNGKIAAYIFMNNGALVSETFELVLNSMNNANSNSTIERHAWASHSVMANPYDGFSQGTSYGSYLHYPYTLGSMACADSVVTVGAFKTLKSWMGSSGGPYWYPNTGEEGGIAVFSAIGPTADGRNKPDIIAGGTNIASARSKDASYDPALLLPSPHTETYAYMQGTSMASPVAAGAIALLLEKNPAWGKENVMNYLSNHAQGTTSEYSATEVKVKNDPNTWERVFGYGGIDLTDAFNPDAVSKDNFISREFNLEQNYPNPFNPETMIKYHLIKACDVKLNIYNSIGQKVRALVFANQSSGSYEITWNGRNDLGKKVSSGIYLIRLEAGTFIQTKKMILMK